MTRRAARGLVVALAALVACGDGVPRPAPMDPLSPDEAAELARRFEAAIEPCDPERIDALFDAEHLMRQAMVHARIRADVKRAALAEAKQRGPFVGRQLCAGFDANTAFDLLRMRPGEHGPRPLFRATSGSGVNYYEVIAGKARSDGAVRVVDLYVYLSGDRMTETIAGMMEQGVRVAQAGERPDLEAIGRARQRGDLTEARRLIAALPPALRDAKAVRLMDLQAAMTLDAPDYAETIERYVRAYPDDPSADFVAVDGHFLRKDVPALLAALDRLELRVGGDPYLDNLRAGGLLLEPTPAHLQEAERRARAVTAALPDRADVWWTLAAVQLARGDHAGLVPTLDRLATAFAVSFDRDAMAAEPQWQGFLASPEFATWWSAHHAR